MKQTLSKPQVTPTQTSHQSIRSSSPYLIPYVSLNTASFLVVEFLFRNGTPNWDSKSMGHLHPHLQKRLLRQQQDNYREDISQVFRAGPRQGVFLVQADSKSQHQNEQGLFPTENIKIIAQSQI